MRAEIAPTACLDVPTSVRRTRSLDLLVLVNQKCVQFGEIVGPTKYLSSILATIKYVSKSLDNGEGLFDDSQCPSLFDSQDV